MVKYRLSTSGISRSCSRVMSPPPAFSTLITSAPNQASNCVQVGPDCTCVKSRIRTPSNALLMRNSGPRSLVHRLILGARRILARIDPDIDHRRTARLLNGLARPLQRRRYLRRVAHLFAVAAEHFGELAERNITEKIAHAAPLLAVFRELAVADLVHRGIVADDREIGHTKAVGRLHVEGRHAEGAVAVVAQHFLGRVREPRRDRKSGAHAERAESARIHPLARSPRA